MSQSRKLNYPSPPEPTKRFSNPENLIEMSKGRKKVPLKSLPKSSSAKQVDSSDEEQPELTRKVVKVLKRPKKTATQETQLPPTKTNRQTKTLQKSSNNSTTASKKQLTTSTSFTSTPPTTVQTPPGPNTGTTSYTKRSHHHFSINFKQKFCSIFRWVFVISDGVILSILTFDDTGLSFFIFLILVL